MRFGPFTLKKERAQLLLIDFQEKLFPKIFNAEEIKPNLTALIECCKILDIPIKYTEQYPAGLGPTISEVLESLPKNTEKLEKIHFSCYGEPGFVHFIQSAGRPQIIVAGIESHICVLSTVLELLRDNYQTVVVSDAIGSRKEKHHLEAIETMRSFGAIVVPTESVVYQLLARAKTPEFKEMLKYFK